MLHDDLLGFTIVIPATAGQPEFRHEFTPRTASEWWFASLAIALSAARPPLLHAVASVAPGEGRTHGPLECLLDPLVTKGGHRWLAALSLGVAAICAWRVARRLRRLGVDRSTTRFWVVASALLGPFGALASALAERPRAWADRRVPQPAPPRIASEVLEETVA